MGNENKTGTGRSLKRLVVPQPCRTCKYFKRIPKNDGWGDCLWAKKHRHALPSCISNTHTTHADDKDCDLWDNKPELSYGGKVQ